MNINNFTDDEVSRFIKKKVSKHCQVNKERVFVENIDRLHMTYTVSIKDGERFTGKLTTQGRPKVEHGNLKLLQ